MISISITDKHNKDFKELTLLLDAELYERYGALQAEYDQYNSLDEIKVVVVAYDDKHPVGCGAIKIYDDMTTELKRMFVKTSYRGRGISKIVLTELEKLSRESGYSRIILETGYKQTEAEGLYLKAGYTKIENYGQYMGNDNSICMGKSLS